MNLFDTVEIVKDFFRQTVKYKMSAPNPNADAAMLHEIGRNFDYVRATDGNNYFYYFLHDTENIDVARFLFWRNGIRVRTHISYKNYEPEEVLRVRARLIKKVPERKEFINKIIDCDSTEPVATFKQRIADIRAQMYAYQK